MSELAGREPTFGAGFVNARGALRLARFFARPQNGLGQPVDLIAGESITWARHLVTSELYRYSRNPMYVSVVLILWGWTVGFGSWTLAIYTLAVMAAFHLRVVAGEEPWLARTHGEAWDRYHAAVPRWVGRSWVRRRGGR